jgi:hypothetical protein
VREEITNYYNTFIYSPPPIHLNAHAADPLYSGGGGGGGRNGAAAADVAATSAISPVFDFTLARERYHAHAAAQGSDAGLVIADNFLGDTALGAYLPYTLLPLHPLTHALRPVFLLLLRLRCNARG